MKAGHYFQRKGALAEKVIHDLATDTFFTDWCYPNAKKPDGNELCDLLVVFDDTAIIWQIKDLKVDEKGRYKKAEVEKNFANSVAPAEPYLISRRPSFDPIRGEAMNDSIQPQLGMFT